MPPQNTAQDESSKQDKHEEFYKNCLRDALLSAMVPVLIVATNEGRESVKKLEKWIAVEWLREWPEEAPNLNPADTEPEQQAKREASKTFQRVKEDLAMKLRLEAVTWKLADNHWQSNENYQLEVDHDIPWSKMFHEALEESRFQYFNIRR
ncbi:hypothetical protein AAF712_016362 [Marasmius tenuissimus]|uniref:Uncharacterized protein n=1 Tax=Marasmius tenuissimus TaxID=585030 RepID=A0ABR2Z8A8_9AGAR